METFDNKLTIRKKNKCNIISTTKQSWHRMPHPSTVSVKVTSHMLPRAAHEIFPGGQCGQENNAGYCDPLDSTKLTFVKRFWFIVHV